MDTSLYVHKKIKNKVTKKAPIFDRLPSLCTLRACNSGASNEGVQHLLNIVTLQKVTAQKKKSADSERVSREELPNLSV